MATPNEIINQAFKKSGVLGVGQTASAEDTNDAFLDLNDMLAQWQRQRWLIWHLVTTGFTSTGAVSYTVGPGGNFNIPRPDRLESAFLRQLVTTQPNQVDYPLGIIQAREDYNRIALKTLSTFPMYVFYDSAYPTGVVYPWPVPQPSIYQLFITTKAHLSRFSTLTEEIDLPPEYIAALKWNLAARLRPSYQLPEDPQITALANIALNVIRNANAQVARLTMPDDVVRNGNYNIFSDQIR